ncbi:MAG: hypothetical protein K2O59_12705 [Lachnospiraceae bacterium]|nr:hypothetical protein [Lachnospiraceae bacterium]
MYHQDSAIQGELPRIIPHDNGKGTYKETDIKDVRYRVYSSYEGDADFRELYEKCLSSRLLKLNGQGCAGDAAGS